MIKIGSEVAEEELQLLLDPLFATMVTGEPYQAPTTEQMLETALVTAITTGILEGPSIVGVEVDYKKFGQDVLKTHTTQDVVQEALNGSRPGSAVYELAKKLSEGMTRGKTVSETDIGRLFAFSQTQLQKGKSVKAEGRTEELLQRALELPADTKAHQVAQELSEQLETALSERGFDLSEDYQLTRPQQQNQINEVTNAILTDQTIGELEELVAEDEFVEGGQKHRLKDDPRAEYRFISQRQFDNLTIKLKKDGMAIIRGTPEVERHLDNMDASSAILGDMVFFRKDVRLSEVLEETYHYEQKKQGLNDDKKEPLRSILNEIDAKEYLLKNAQKFRIPRKEIDLLKKHLESCKKQLADYS